MNFDRFRKNIPDTEEMIEKVDGIIASHQEDQSIVIDLSGKIDAKNFNSIQEDALKKLQQEEITGLIFNMEDVSYVSSAGLRMFAVVHETAQNLQKSYKLIKMRRDIYKQFQLTGYASTFCIEVKSEN